MLRLKERDPMTDQHSKLLILGAGPAGYTAAIYAARANLSPILVAGLQPGGQLTITNDVENYPGFARAVQGPWLMDQMQAQAEHVGAQIIQDSIVEVDLSRRPFVAIGDSGRRYSGETLAICTGAQARWLGLDSERQFQGFGVSACATCDGFFFRGKRVAVVGGGNTAVEEAIYLAGMASHVTLIHRKGDLRAEKIAQDRLFALPNVSLLWHSVVEEVLGGGTPPGVTGLRLRHLQTDAETSLGIDGLFIAIGHVPNTAMFVSQLAMDQDGYIITRAGSTETSVAGVFAAGDVQDRIFRQAVTAAATGCMAALEADRFLTHHGQTAALAAQ
jgi:thioredoxin reductase (NADPH)